MDISKFNFMQKYEMLNENDTLEGVQAKAVKIAPSKLQLEWQQLELTAFFHYGMNTYTDVEWGSLGTPISKFEANDNFNPKQWIKTIKEAGFTAAIFTAKHHDGFCLWPSKYTEYSIKNSSYKNGKGDMVAEFAEACREYDIKFGVYLSPWDINEKTYGDSDKYNEHFINQLTELLCDYDDVYEMWFDGACGEGPNGKKQVYDWQGIFEHIKKVSPNTIMSIMGPEVRWVGNEAGKGREEEWSTIPFGQVMCKDSKEQAFITTGGDLCNQDLGSDDVLMKMRKENGVLYWSPAQVDVSIRRGWFYHEMEDNAVRSLDDLVKIYYSSVGSNAQLLLNIPPNKDGLVSDTDVKRIKEFGEFLTRTFSVNFAQDSDIDEKKEGSDYVTTIKLAKKDDINLIAIMEDITKGQRVASYEILVKQNDEFISVAQGKTVGYKSMATFDRINTDEIKIITNKYRAEPIYSFFGVYNAPSLNSAVVISRDDEALVSIKASSNKAKIYYSINEEKPNILYTAPFIFKDSGTIFAVAYLEDSNLFSNDAPIVTLKVGMFKENWETISHTGTICKGPYDAKNMVFDTACHNMVANEKEPYFVLDMKQEQVAKGFLYTPISHILDFIYNIFEYEVSFSKDNINFEVAAKGRFDNIRNNPVQQEVIFDKPCSGRYIKIKSLRGCEENQVAFGKISIIK